MCVCVFLRILSQGDLSINLIIQATSGCACVCVCVYVLKGQPCRRIKGGMAAGGGVRSALMQK